MMERLGVSDATTARSLWQEHFRVYNQSLRALRAGAGFSFDTAEYWDFIRAGASDFLRPDPAVSPLADGKFSASMASLTDLHSSYFLVTVVHCCDMQVRFAA